MTMKKLLSVLLAAVLLLVLCACGKEAADTNTDGGEAVFDEAGQLADVVGLLTVRGDAEVQVAYDENGNAVAVSGQNSLGVAAADAYTDFAGKTCAQVVRELIDVICDQNTAIAQGYVLVLQEPDSAAPSASFLNDVVGEAGLNKGAYTVVPVSATAQDADGRFNQDTALAIMDAYLGGTEGVSVTCSEAPVDGTYSVTCTDTNGLTTDYSIDAWSGTVSVVENTEQAEAEDPYATEDVPESDVFDPISDVEAAAGTDGGVDNGSV